MSNVSSFRRAICQRCAAPVSSSGTPTADVLEIPLAMMSTGAWSKRSFGLISTAAPYVPDTDWSTGSRPTMRGAPIALELETPTGKT